MNRKEKNQIRSKKWFRKLFRAAIVLLFCLYIIVAIILDGIILILTLGKVNMFLYKAPDKLFKK